MPTLTTERQPAGAASGARPAGDSSRPLGPAPAAAPRSAAQVRKNLTELEQLLGRHGLENGRQQVVEKLRDLEAPSELLVFVVGEGNFGKSSLINQVLGREVAEVSFLPKTWRIDLYHGVGPGEAEHCLLRRVGSGVSERLSIEAAVAACQEQEKQIRERGQPGDEAELTTLPGQIIEARWHYAGLKLPKNVVLVDTPGFGQLREGLNRAATKTLGGRNGLAFDLGEVYEEYYHRATLALWAFKATQLNARETMEVFGKLSLRGTRILGVLTCVDHVPAGQRDELLARARSLYGSGVQEFVPVVAGGKGPEVGLGIPDLRRRLTDMGPGAEAIKWAQADQFCRFLAQSGAQWMEGIGDALIHNVTQVSLYCNATSERLLMETRCRYAEVAGAYDAVLKKKKAALNSYTANLLNTLANHPSIRWSIFGVDSQKRRDLKELFRDELAKHLEIEELDQRLRASLERVRGYVAAEGSRIASGYQMKQVLVQAAGEYTIRPLSARITPPDLGNLHVSLPSFAVPPPPDGWFNGLLRLFGKASVPQTAVGDAVDNIRIAIGELAEHLLTCARQQTQAIAEAILKSCDQALAEVYAGKELKALKPMTEQLDSDLALLHRIAAAAEPAAAAHYRYATLYGIWSPRDDLRAAVIDLFCEWFQREWPLRQPEASGWVNIALAQHPLALRPVERCIAAYLNETGQHSKSEPTYAGAIRGKSLRRPGLVDVLRKWRDGIHADLCRRVPFSEEEFTAKELKDIKYVKLTGIAQDFAKHLGDSYGARFEGDARSISVPAARCSLGTSFNIGLATAWLVCLGLATAGLIDAVSLQHVQAGLLAAFNTLAHSHASLRSPPEVYWALFIGVGALSVTLGAVGLSWAAVRAWRAIRCRNMARQMAPGLHYEALCLAESTWREVVGSLNDAARQIVGMKTLADKRPLDYAIEGAFDSYQPSAS